MMMKKLTANDPESRSPNLVAQNVERLKALFPEILTEGPNGAAVNVDVLVDLRYPVKRNPVVLAVFTAALGQLDVTPIDMIDGGELRPIRADDRHVFANLLRLIHP